MTAARLDASKFTGLITFNDDTATRGQLLFFGGFPSGPTTQMIDNVNVVVASNVRTCSGCHAQAGAGSDSHPNTPAGTANRQRATGASDDPRSPVCLEDADAQSMIFNADGGFGAGKPGFPFKDSNQTMPQDCTSTFLSIFFPNKSCFKKFIAKTDTTMPTTPPLSNPKITGQKIST